MTQRTENSGLIDLDALLREAKARESAPELPPVEVPQPASKTKLTDDSLEAVSCEPRSDPWIATPSASKKIATPSVPPIEPQAPARAQRPPRVRGGNRKGVVIGLSLALVAGGIVLLRPRTAVAPQAAKAPANVVSPSTEVPKAAAAPPPAEAPGVAALSPNDLPLAAASANAPARGSSPTSKPSTPLDLTKRTLLTEAELAPLSAEHGDLGSAMRDAVGTTDTPAAVANRETAGPAAAQLHPSQGALVGAIGAVLPTARACLGPDEPVRNGLLVFKSDGSVARVELRGSKPEDECVRAALSKAKVAPFVDDTFSTRVTVRP